MLQTSFFLLMMVLVAGNAAADEIHGRMGEVSSLSGKAVVELYYGAPGYGASPARDEKIHVLILLLDQPLSLPIAPGWSEAHNDVRRIQLMVDTNRLQQDPSLLRNRPVTVEGELFEAYDPAHTTGVMMRVSGITLR